VGVWTFGKKKWTKDPITRRRRYKRRDEKDVKRQFREHLIIIEPEVWDAVRKRREAVRNRYKGQRTNAAPGQRTKHAFSGLLVCGVCGAWMVDGGGSRSRYYRCSRP
jgi:hypothetical protein